MSKLLILGDIHGRSFWKDAIDKYGNDVDKIVMIGDYIDPYGDEGITRKDAINTLSEIIDFKFNNKDKTILLIGNHDAHYLFDNFPRCTRYDSSHAYKIKEKFHTHKSLFKLAHEEIINGKKYLFTHAGLMNSWIERNKNIIGEPTVDNLNKLVNIHGGILALSDISNHRTWFGEKSGSILWSDVLEKIDDNSSIDNIIPNEDSIVEGYDYQIFGHTQLVDKPIITDKWACIDCRKPFILNENGKLIEG